MYKIANVIFDIQNVKNDDMIKGLLDFYTTDSIPDITYKIKYVDDFSTFDIHDCFSLSQNLYIQKNDNFFTYYYVLENSIYAVVVEKNNLCIIYLPKEIISSSLHKYFLPSILGLERHIIKKDSFFLHSSSIVFQNHGILFTAPSGGGKSTQADLWMQYMDANIINGDRNTVGKENNKWYIYGTPFSGSSQYCINKKVKLSAIIILLKGNNNTLVRMNPKDFSKIFSQVTVNPWNKAFCDKIMNLVIELCNTIPVYVYTCVKDESAVLCLYNLLVKDGVFNEFVK